MFNLNASAILALVVLLGTILVFSLALAFHDTMRGFCELFDFRVIRKAGRSFRHRPRVLLTLFLSAATIIPLFALIEKYLAWPALDTALVFSYILIVVFPLVYWFVAEAFGPGPRDRWRDFLCRKHTSGIDTLKKQDARARRP